MLQKIKFKALTYYGKLTTFTKQIECPDFKTMPPSKFHEVQLPEVTIESQIIDWFDEQDKSSLMIEMDLGVIIDYWIPEKKKVNPTMLDYLKQASLSEEIILDLMAVYKEIKPLLKGKSVNTQIQMMFSHLNVGYQAAYNAYQNIGKIMKAETSEEARKLMCENKKVS